LIIPGGIFVFRFRIVSSVFFLIFLLSAAAAAGVICNKCGEPILGAHEIQLDGKYYHKKCLTCDDCGVALDISQGYIIQGDKHYHADCYNRDVIKWCYVCGQNLDRGYCVDPWGHPYHKRHDGDHPRCDYCRRFVTQEVTNDGVYYSDGRTICSLCLASAIASQDSASAILEAVRDTLATIGIDIDPSGISVRLLGKDAMKKRFGVNYRNPDGMTRAYFDPVTGEPEYRLYLLTGMPKIRFITAVAHELMHVWLFRNQDKAVSNDYPTNKLLIEGSCSLAAYKTLQHYSGEEARVTMMMIEQNRILHYGMGFPEAEHYAATHNTGQWLKYIMTHGKYPSISSK
jgi:hypothetical protein